MNPSHRLLAAASLGLMFSTASLAAAPQPASTMPRAAATSSASAVPLVSRSDDGSGAVTHLGIDYTVSSNAYLGEVHECYEVCFEQATEDRSGYEWTLFLDALGLLPQFLTCAVDFTDHASFAECMAGLFLDNYEMGVSYSEAPGFEDLYDCLDTCDETLGHLDGCTGGGCEGADEPEKGDDCNTDYDCGTEMYCSQVRMTCQLRVDIGDACARDDVCASDCCEYDRDVSLFYPTCVAESVCGG